MQGERVAGMYPAPGPKFLHFHEVFGRNLPNKLLDAPILIVCAPRKNHGSGGGI